MGWTAASFKARWEEFAPKSDALVQAVIAEAVDELDARLFGSRFDTAVGLLAAHKLSISPRGQTGRKEKGTADDPLAQTTYGLQLMQLMQGVAGGPWVVGQQSDGSVR